MPCHHPRPSNETVTEYGRRSYNLQKEKSHDSDEYEMVCVTDLSRCVDLVEFHEARRREAKDKGCIRFSYQDRSLAEAESIS